MFIDETYFTGDIFIANLNEKKDNLLLSEWIERWEEQCLRTILGDCLYNEFLENLEWDDTEQSYVLVNGADEKWDWLLNGHTYTRDDISTSSTLCFDVFNFGCCNNCNNFYWDGLIKIVDRRIKTVFVDNERADGIKIKKSLMAYYIYWLWALKTDTITTSTGEQIADVKNSTRISNEHLRIDAHNKFVSMVQGNDCSGNVSLYKFLHDFGSTYSNWSGKALRYESVW